MKTCLNLIGSIALVVGLFSGFLLISTANDEDSQTETGAAELMIISVILSPASLLIAAVVFVYTRRMGRIEYEETGGIYQPPPTAAPNEEDLLIRRAQALYQSGDLDGAKAILRSMPNNPSAKKVLARLNQR